ncbi:MAG: hypothetical protein JOS17DRAFT_780015 [Linnemannia elongata]|nr:MAG: hypothetical protein JOS17DRAFT_780015 [Linnemannia elongata]
MDVDMHIDMEPNDTTAQSGTSSLTLPLPSTTTLTSLPTELILQVLSSLPLPILLTFRLVSTWANTLVLEPVFWHRLEFSKQLLFKVGGAAGSSTQRLQHRRTGFGFGGGGGGVVLPRGTGARAGARKESVFQHSSDANLIVHRQSLAATLLSPTSSWVEDTRAVAGLDAGGAGPSVAISANIPRSIQEPHHHQRDILSSSPTSLTATQQLPKHSPWTKIETSFLSFLTRLAHNPRTAYGVRTIVLEDWEGTESVQVLWTTLSAFRKLQTLVIRNSALRHLRFQQSNDCNIDKDDGMTAWPELQELDFQDCVQLRDLEGIQAWLPHLKDLSLAGCTALDDLSPLTLTRPFLSSSPTPPTVQALALKKASFIHTRIRDEELIALLRRSPKLEELQLDQCYGLTVRALKAIAFGDQNPVSFGDGTKGSGRSSGVDT